MEDYLGQVVESISCYSNFIQNLKYEKSIDIKNLSFLSDGNYKELFLFVSSKNELKIEAAIQGIYRWISGVYRPQLSIKSMGLDVSSEIDEQPIGFETTFLGAMNRLKNLKFAMQKEIGISLDEIKD